mgnify:CR=1 FL=1
MFANILKSRTVFPYLIGTPILHKSEYKSTVTRESSKYLRYSNERIYLYAGVHIHVSNQGNYDVFINSTEALYIDLYENYVDFDNLAANLLFHHDENYNISQIKFTINFHSNRTYYLIISTIYSNVTFSFSLILTGPSPGNLNETSVYF